MALLEEGGVRKEPEDNIYFEDERNRLAANLELVKRLASIAKTFGKEPYNLKESMKILGFS